MQQTAESIVTQEFQNASNKDLDWFFDNLLVIG
jgi:hypothetical protein